MKSSSSQTGLSAKQSWITRILRHLQRNSSTARVLRDPKDPKGSGELGLTRAESRTAEFLSRREWLVTPREKPAGRPVRDFGAATLSQFTVCAKPRGSDGGIGRERDGERALESFRPF